VIEVVVSDSGIPTLAATNRFTVVVTKGNNAPVLGPLADRTVMEGTLLTVSATATDPDMPAQTLTFSLGVGAPSTAAITPEGVFTWTPTDSDGPGTNRITIVVTDSGEPAASDTQTFVVIVNEMYLQAGAHVTGPYEDEPAAVFDAEARTITIPRPAHTSFFRLRCNLPVRITRIGTSGDQLLLDYDYQ
jgi:hypothetical protein